MKITGSLSIVFIAVLLLIPAKGNKAEENNEATKLVVLGSGNPNPDPDHSGCSLAIVVNNSSYIVDFGPGLVRQAAALTPRYGGNIAALAPKNLKTAFLTHLHSDHTTGYPDFILTPWVMGRDEPLEVYGPEGTGEMTENILKAYKEDIKYRIYGEEPANNQGWRVNVHEIDTGVVYKDNNVKVEAFKVEHGSWPDAYGYRFTTPDKVIVVSGDTRPCDNIIKYAKGADILVHEVYYKAGWDKRDSTWQKYHAAHHTSTYELGRIASEAKPGLVVLYHILYWGATDQDLLDEIAKEYTGKVIVGHDRGVY